MTMISNKLMTPDGTILESLHRHDCVFYKDKNGKEYMLDGGLDYVRRSNNGDEISIVLHYENTPFEVIRKVAYRLGYGKPGNPDYGKLRKTLICDMSDKHLQNSLDYVKNKGGVHWLILLEEKLYRSENEISIKDS